MKITSIKQQERLKGRYSIYVDEKYSFSLNADTLLREGVIPGQELDEQVLRSYKKLSEDDKAYGLAVAYVARRMRSSGELRDYFRRKGYEAELQDQILGKLELLGLVDDKAFAEAWVRNRRLLRSTSKRRLVLELKQKHVGADIIDLVLNADESDDGTVLAALVIKKRRQSKYQDDFKLMQYLARQGFTYDNIKSALNTEND